jgi:hypothetical protein
MESKLEKRLRMLGGSGEGVKGPQDWTAELAELLDDVDLAITAVNDYGQPALVGQGEVTVKPFLLLRKWSAIPVSIQPGFTDRHDSGPSSQLDDERPVNRFSLGDMVGLNPHCGENAGMVACDLKHGRTVSGRGTNCNDLD